jgi:hypothetical protein
MTVVESKLRTGRLVLSDGTTTVDFACQPTSVIIKSSYKEDGDPVEVLCGDTLPAATTVAKSLVVTAIQDFDNPAGFMRYLRDHELQEIEFAWQANPAAEVAAGTVQSRQGDWGGDVGKRLTTAPEMPIITLDWLPPPPVATGATAGTPGTWTPAGSMAPRTLSDLQTADPAITATPAAVWGTGESVVLGDASAAHWSGTAWSAGAAA